MKINDITKRIQIENFLFKARDKKFKMYYEKYLQFEAENIFTANLFCMYKINEKFIEEVFERLSYCTDEKEFKDVEYCLIVFRDLLSFIDFFKERYKFLSKSTLNFKYITKEQIKILKNDLKDFEFYFLGLTFNLNYSCLCTFKDSCVVGCIHEKNLYIFEKSLRCVFNDIPLLITDNKFNYEFFRHYEREELNEKCF